MGLFSRWRRGGGGVGGDGRRQVLDREATSADLDHLRAFAKSREGVAFYVEPETTATDTTVVAVAFDGEWTRRRVGTPKAAEKLARVLANDPAMGVLRHVDAGYPEAEQAADAGGLRIPMAE